MRASICGGLFRGWRPELLLPELRAEVAATARRLRSEQLVTGTSGNVSARDPLSGLVAITPSGLAYESLGADDVVVLDPLGQPLEGSWLPSSEVPMHLAVYRADTARHAIVHTHSPYATAFASCGREIPAVHYEIAFVGSVIRVAPYATYGTEELARNALVTLGADSAVLLRNHGVLAVGPTLGRAFTSAQKVEFLAALYYRTLQIGTPIILSDEEIARVRERFVSYGQPRAGEVAISAELPRRRRGSRR